MRLLQRRALRALLGLVCVVAPSAAWAADSATASITVTAEFGSRTSLKVSNQVLRFELSDPSLPAVAEVEFSAGARTRSGGDVVLTIEPLRAVDGPGGAADVETAITFSGTGYGILAGSLQNANVAIAGRWTGSGLRTGRLTFTLRATASGTYTMPLRFVLSTP